MWDSILTVLGLTIAFGGSILISKYWPSLTLGKVATGEQWIPDYIDSYGNVVMRKVQ